MRRHLPRPAVAALLSAAALLTSACAPTGTATLAAMDLPADPGAASRQAALARVDRDRLPDTTPSILGRTPAAAQALLADLGLELHLVPFDRRTTVTTQWPPAGQPVPLDGVIEGWLGRPPQESPADGGAAVASVPVPAAATATATAAPAPTPTTTTPEATGAVSYVLPPHTDGLLRVNPRRLPALPLGTQLLGRASWYGPGFHGLTTACGGVFDRNGPTLASRELRCGTVVRITGPSGLTVEATVTDWGPAEWTGRRFDLSEAVFNAIAPLGAGVIDVSVVTANVPG